MCISDEDKQALLESGERPVSVACPGWRANQDMQAMLESGERPAPVACPGWRANHDLPPLFSSADPPPPLVSPATFAYHELHLLLILEPTTLTRITYSLSSVKQHNHQPYS